MGSSHVLKGYRQSEFGKVDCRLSDIGESSGLFRDPRNVHPDQI
jgi:hypothetical protein